MTVTKERSDGTCLLLCRHDHIHQYPVGGWAAVDMSVRASEGAVRRLGADSEAQAREMLRPEETLDYYGAMRCRICGGDEFTTDTFNRPVVMLARVAKGARRTEDVLF